MLKQELPSPPTRETPQIPGKNSLVQENELPAETKKSLREAKNSMTKMERKPQKTRETGPPAAKNVIRFRPVEIGV
jgi:hypothetical protein